MITSPSRRGKHPGRRKRHRKVKHTLIIRYIAALAPILAALIMLAAPLVRPAPGGTNPGLGISATRLSQFRQAFDAAALNAVVSLADG